MTDTERKTHYALQIENGVNYLRYNAFKATNADIIRVCKHVTAAVELLEQANQTTENADIVGNLAALADMAKTINKRPQHYEQ